MMNKSHLLICLLALILFSCSSGGKKDYKDDYAHKMERKSGSDDSKEEDEKPPAKIEDLPLVASEVLITAHPDHKLIPVYRRRWSKYSKRFYIDGNYSHSSGLYQAYEDGNQWNGHYMPGFKAVYGVYMMNVSHYSVSKNERKRFFDEGSIVNTLYYPAYRQDTLYGKAVTRDFYMASVYDEDTNKDGRIDWSDLRRFYLFDLDANNKTPIVPANYSVQSSQYDPKNDAMYVYAKVDENGDGSRDLMEAIHIFYLDLKAPGPANRLF